MAQKKVNFVYDMEEDILHFFSGEKVQDSIEFGNFVFDIAYNGKIVGWQINNASTFLSQIYDTKIQKDVFSNIQEARMSAIYSKELVFIRVVFSLKTEKGIIQRELTSNIPEIVVT